MKITKSEVSETTRKLAESHIAVYRRLLVALFASLYGNDAQWNAVAESIAVAVDHLFFPRHGAKLARPQFAVGYDGGKTTSVSHDGRQEAVGILFSLVDSFLSTITGKTSQNGAGRDSIRERLGITGTAKEGYTLTDSGAKLFASIIDSASKALGSSYPLGAAKLDKLPNATVYTLTVTLADGDEFVTRSKNRENAVKLGATFERLGWSVVATVGGEIVSLDAETPVKSEPEKLTGATIEPVKSEPVKVRKVREKIAA